jgi:hypothetical protein
MQFPARVVLLHPWYGSCLTRRGAAHQNDCGSEPKIIYEKASIRLNRSCCSFVTTQPERSSALGLLSSLLRRISLCFLASPLLAWRLLVWWILASGLLVSWPGGRGGALLIGPPKRKLTSRDLQAGSRRRPRPTDRGRMDDRKESVYWLSGCLWQHCLPMFSSRLLAGKTSFWSCPQSLVSNLENSRTQRLG